MTRRTRSRLRLLVAFLVLGLIAAWYITRPEVIPESAISGLTGDPARGKLAFDLGGCASCHAEPEAEGPARLLLGGGRRIVSPFGTFLVPNISPDPETGIGTWSDLDFVNALRFGTSPAGEHYYPAFPYPSYRRADIGDLVDMKAYIETLAPVKRANEPHEIPFPFSIRLSLGGWKMLFLSGDPVLDPSGLSEQARQGQKLVEGLGHCGECHTPRGVFGNLQKGSWLAGAPNPSGKGRIPALTPGDKGLSWSAGDIAEYLKSGFTPDFDTAGGEMADVIENTSQLSDEDRAAIAAYIKALPPG